MRRQPAKWIADNPDAYKRGVRSFWLTALPIIKPFLMPQLSLKCPCPTTSYSSRLSCVSTPQVKTRTYSVCRFADESSVERQQTNNVLLIHHRCGCRQKQNNGQFDIRVDNSQGGVCVISTIQSFVALMSGQFYPYPAVAAPGVAQYQSGKGLKISMTCVDSGGHYTQEVYAACRARFTKRVFAIKGKGGPDIPFLGCSVFPFSLRSIASISGSIIRKAAFA